MQLTGCGAQGQDMSYLQPTTKLNDQPRSESVGLFVSSLGTDRHLQRSVLPVDGRNHLWQCFLPSTDFGERKPEALAICWLVDGQNWLQGVPCRGVCIVRDCSQAKTMKITAL